ncbi:MAG: TonB-dependent receptor domain-containing protein [Burkholderiaceae bacterium]|jgi:vitamin B12 transporter
MSFSIRFISGARRFRIAQLLLNGLPYVLLAVIGHAHGADAPTLPNVIVTATRQPTRVDELIADTTVIERVDIERARGRTLSDLLARQPGIQLSANGGPGKFSSVFIRGLEARHTLVLIDGVRYGSATTGTPALDNIPLANIERIEIVRGPLSGLYGSEAVGGVIQIFTRGGGDVPPGARGQAALTVGTNATTQVEGAATLRSGPWTAAVSAQRLDTDGFSATNDRVPFGSYNADRDGFRQTSGNVRLGYRVNDAWRVDGSVLQARGKSRFDDGPGAVDTRGELSTEVYTLQTQGRVNRRWGTTLRLASSRDVFDTVAASSPFSLGAFATTQDQLAWENTVTTPLGSVLLLAEHLKQSVGKTGAAYAVGDRTINALALGLNGHGRGFTWQTNLRRDRNSQFDDKTTGALGLGYALTSRWRVGASYGRTFVAPSFNQLYYPSFGNPNLQPEEGKHAELNLRYDDGANQWKAAVFENRIRGFISSTALPTNIPRATVNGISLGYDRRWAAWTFGAALDHVDPKNSTAGTPTSGNLLPRRARNSFKASADVEQGSWSAGSTFTAFSQRYDDVANTARLAGYGTLDLRADWRYDRRWTLGVRANNIADKKYETALGYNQAGREFYVTLQYAGM